MSNHDRCNGLPEKIAQKILDKNADYLLAVKGNQGSLEQGIGDFYKPSMLKISTKVTVIRHKKRAMEDLKHVVHYQPIICHF